MKKRTLLFSLVSVLFLFSCSSDDDSINEERSKQYPVNLNINTLSGNETLQMLLFTEGMGFNYSASKGGNGGVSLVRWNDEIRAYDRACPYEWDQRVTLPLYDYPQWVREVECTSCGSIYDTSTGKAISGKAKDAGLDLVRYRVELKKMEKYPNQKELIVTN